ncbi:MAG: hypothetical protein Q4B67_00135 [Eubacteriales bacterium]|nr:hypothetical protein [Eubacteriales bacterium]
MKKETEMSATELRQESARHLSEFKRTWKVFFSVGAVVVSAVIAIVALTNAWFVMNTSVNATTSTISAADSTTYLFASAGVRQDVEVNKYKDEGGNNILEGGGTPQRYTQYYDINTGSIVSQNVDLYIGSAWRLDAQKELLPGEHGKLDFYVIPTVDGLTQLDFILETAPYKDNAEGTRVVPVTDEDKISGTDISVLPILKPLLDGHILFFSSFDESAGYSGWLGGFVPKDGGGVEFKNVITLAPAGGFIKDVPYKFSIYWVWPRRYRNLFLTNRAGEGDLFTVAGTDHTKLLEFLNANYPTVTIPESFYYNKGSVINPIQTKVTGMEDADYYLGAAYYNFADEFIGYNSSYLYVEMH